MRFKDKIVLITGSAGGIGFKTALDFGNEGAIVAVTDIDFEMAKKLSNQIISNGGISEPLQLDVTNLEQTKNAILPLNPQENVCYPFEINVNTQLLEKDDFKPVTFNQSLGK